MTESVRGGTISGGTGAGDPDPEETVTRRRRGRGNDGERGRRENHGCKSIQLSHRKRVTPKKKKKMFFDLEQGKG